MNVDKTDVIVKLDHADADVARQIKSLHDVAYAAEARLLGLKEFPPLNRTLESYANANSTFFGCRRDGSYIGSVELDVDNSSVFDISSLVVDPRFSRQGIATKLMKHVLSIVGPRRVVVSTGAANYPAINLYEGLGFQKADEWTTDDGLRIVELAKAAGKAGSAGTG